VSGDILTIGPGDRITGAQLVGSEIPTVLPMHFLYLPNVETLTNYIMVEGVKVC
jgi:hypothetical protein